jgi:hypothetical protein
LEAFGSEIGLPQFAGTFPGESLVSRQAILYESPAFTGFSGITGLPDDES